MEDRKNARLDELSPPSPPLDPPPPYEELQSTGDRSSTNFPGHGHHDTSSPRALIINFNASRPSSSNIQPAPSSPDPAPNLLSSKRAAAQQDPASPSSSSQSIPPAPRSPSDQRRTLLLVYVHGFYGNDQSFRSFPAHVHHRLSASPALSRSHVVHSKIYPRYKTYKAVDVARDNFSAWLEPHESPTTDVVLLGHSMGGILAAEVVLKPSEVLSPRPFKHRILGTVSLDAPFLGLHPGIVVSGISSLFRPPDADPSTSTSTSSPNADTVTEPGSPADPNFDPPYFNDTPFRERSFLDRVVNFASKHSREGLLHALGTHFTDHLAFGGCLADYRGLVSRYDRLRALEDAPATPPLVNPSSARVRFVNYYTLCPGRPKPSKAPPAEESTPPAEGTRSPSCEDPHASNPDETEKTDAGTAPAETRSSSPLSLQDLEPTPIQDEHPLAAPESSYHHHEEKEEQHVSEPTILGDGASDAVSISLSLSLSLPLPTPPPSKPEPPDFSQYTDKEARKQAEREFSRLEKAYARDLKSHEKTLRERQKLADKQRKQLDRQAEKELKEQRKQADRDFKEEQKQAEKDIKDERKQPEKHSKDEHKQAEKDLQDEDKQEEKDLEDERKQAEKLLKDERKQAEKSAKDERRQAEKAAKEEHKQAEKAAREELKQAEKAAKEERKHAEKSLKDERKNAEKAAKDERKHAEKILKEERKQAEKTAKEERKLARHDKPKLRKFCSTPRAADPGWVSVFMDGVDEVGAHCGLFAPGAHYDDFVRDVGDRIVGWVEEAQGR